MPIVSRVIAVPSSAELAESLRFAFEREDTEVTLVEPDQALGQVRAFLSESPVRQDQGDEASHRHDVILVSAASEADASSLLHRLRGVVKEAQSDVPILYLGNELGYKSGVRAGANAVLHQPLFLRDVVVTAGLLAARKRAQLARGDLRPFGGLFHLTRALTQMGRSGVLTAVRGLRRGEIRFYEGEVTSSQVGTLHGLAALHHLMLWQVGTFELRFESVVHRQQIPMQTAELMADLHRYLAEVDEVGQHLHLYGAYEQAPEACKGVYCPDEIRSILYLMDGSRTVADLIEDSPFRMFDTLRIADRLVELGMVEHREEISSDFGFKLRRRIRDSGLDLGIPSLVDDEDTGRATRPIRAVSTPEAKTKRTSPEPRPEEMTVDWSSVMPTSTNTEDKLAQVVPSYQTAGEISVRAPTDQPREAVDQGSQSLETAPSDDGRPVPEKLETFTDPAERDTLFALGEVPASVREARDEVASSSANIRTGRRDGGTEDADDEEPMSEESDATNDEKPGRDVRADQHRPRQKTRPPTKDQGFTADEEAFFREGSHLADEPAPPVETFEDLDAGYRPVSFWQRLFGRGRRRHGHHSEYGARNPTTSGKRQPPSHPKAEPIPPDHDSSSQGRPEAGKASQFLDSHLDQDGAVTDTVEPAGGARVDDETIEGHAKSTSPASDSGNLPEADDMGPASTSAAHPDGPSDPDPSELSSPDADPNPTETPADGPSSGQAKSATEPSPAADTRANAAPPKGEPARRPSTKSIGAKRKKRKRKR